MSVFDRALSPYLAKTAKSLSRPRHFPLDTQVGVCCFDKTGTLTSEDLVMRGVAPLSPSTASLDARPAAKQPSSGPPDTVKGSTEETGLLAPGEWPDEASVVLAGCHGLVSCQVA